MVGIVLCEPVAVPVGSFDDAFSCVGLVDASM